MAETTARAARRRDEGARGGMRTCPICGREVHKSKYLAGWHKCMECCARIKEMRNDRDYLVSCLPLFYGRFWEQGGRGKER